MRTEKNLEQKFYGKNATCLDSNAFKSLAMYEN